VTPLGREFYDRTLVKVVLTTPQAGRFTLWCPGYARTENIVASR